MKTTVIENGKANNTAVTAKADNSSNVQEKVNGLLLSKDFNDKAIATAEPKKEEATAQAVDQKPQTDTPQQQAAQPKPEVAKAESEQPKVEATKKELKEEAQHKTVLNLEGTLKLVEELHRRKIQRDRLIDTIDTLEAFEVAQIDDADETEANHFQGCVLTIEDDNRRKFTTKNPVIIQAVAQFVNRMCVDRLAEIEAGIIIPA